MRDTGFTSRKAAVPRSFSVATEPIARRIAASEPNWPTFLATWSTASAAVGGGIATPIPARGEGVDDLAEVAGGHRRQDPETDEEARDHGQPEGSPRLEQLLA